MIPEPATVHIPDPATVHFTAEPMSEQILLLSTRPPLTSISSSTDKTFGKSEI